MEKYPTRSIKVSEQTYRMINALVGVMREREKKPVSIDKALSEILPKTTRAKPSDFAGAWKMSDAEAKRLKSELRDVWKLWKRY